MKVMSLDSENCEGLNCSKIVECAATPRSQAAFLCTKLEYTRAAAFIHWVSSLILEMVFKRALCTYLYIYVSSG